eukprot:TRINITY_DN6951_c0_g1_i1.p1 TRINITY_DN6951_c0_g1~~TRINITY_DN6951_c0_g1_i1.p1  ORF type:complete len:235 (+),score=56.80 TRINITY_DN6951_c0_g1_i1:71-775(+)
MLRERLQEDSVDLYHRYAKWTCVPAILVYIIRSLISSHQLEENPNHKITSTSRDSGLRMELNEPFPAYLLNLHYISAILLFLIIILQKETVKKMSQNYSQWNKTHKRLGNLCLTLAFCMDVGGYFMGFYSSMTHFTFFNFFFALPWVLWIVSIYISAKTKSYQLHQLSSNMLLKGCLAVPFSRLGGALLQRCGWEEAEGYYQGIGAVSVLIAVWQCYELYGFFSRKEKVDVKKL